MTLEQHIDLAVRELYAARALLNREKRLGRTYDQNALATLESQIDYWESWESRPTNARSGHE